MEPQTATSQKRGSYYQTFVTKTKVYQKKNNNHYELSSYQKVSKVQKKKEVRPALQPSLPPKNSKKYVLQTKGPQTTEPSAQEHVDPQQKKFIEMFAYFASKQKVYNMPTAGTPVFSPSIDEGSGPSKLNYWKVVQNGAIIHNETFLDGNQKDHKFDMFEDKLKLYSESAHSSGPRSKIISLPTFIEVQE